MDYDPNKQGKSRQGGGMKLRTSLVDILNVKGYFKLGDYVAFQNTDAGEFINQTSIS